MHVRIFHLQSEWPDTIVIIQEVSYLFDTLASRESQSSKACCLINAKTSARARANWRFLFGGSDYTFRLPKQV
jgi:hypothetical protein